MLERRKDYILNRYVIIAEKRDSRPQQFVQKEDIVEPKVCFFCPGNEKVTPFEIGRVEEKGSWKIRWFANKFPFLDIKTKSYGYHEIIVETSKHSSQLWDLNKDELKQVLEIYALRIKELSKDKKIQYVSIFKNHGIKGGTSILHTHTQIGAIDYIPVLIEEKIKYSHKGKKCLYCSIIRKESKSKRKIFENKSFVSFCPYASRFNFEVWIFPKKHITTITDLNEEQISDLSEVMVKILTKLKKLNSSYNFHIDYAPKGKDLHFHIEIIPRIASWAGFEYATGTIVNSVSPESAAKFYR